MMRTILNLDEVIFRGTFVDDGGHFEFDVMKTLEEDSFRKNVHDYVLGAIEDFQPIEAYLNEYESWA